MEKKEELIKLTAALQEEGMSNIQYYIRHTIKRKNTSRNEKWKTKELADDWIYLAEAKYRGKRGRTYFTQFGDEKEIAEYLRQTAEVCNEDCLTSDVAGERYQALECTCHPCTPIEKKAIQEKLVNAEQAALSIPGVLIVEYCTYEQEEQEIYLVNEMGGWVHDSTAHGYFTIGVIAGNPDNKETASGAMYGRTLEEMDWEQCARKAAVEAVSRLDARPVVSGTYKVILANTVLAELTEAYLPAFYLRNILDGKSPLENQGNHRIADEDVILLEDPFYLKGHCRRSMDDDGNQVKKKYLIREGKLESVLADRNSAMEAKVKATGNGFKPSLQSDVGTGVTNVILHGKNAGRTVEEIKQETANGIYVTEVDGVFAGTNAETGAFSLIVKGRVLRQGKESEPFREVTIAGNYFDILKRKIVFGDDYIVTPPDLASVVAPSAYVGELSVSGK